MIRELQTRDLPKLKEMGFDWPMGEDFICGLVYVDSRDEPIMTMAAWSRAEVHMARDANWQTPMARMIAMEKLHDAMENKLREKHVGEVVTYFSTMDRICKRLSRLGWVRSANTSWHRAVRGIK